MRRSKLLALGATAWLLLGSAPADAEAEAASEPAPGADTAVQAPEAAPADDESADAKAAPAEPTGDSELAAEPEPDGEPREPAPTASEEAPASAASEAPLPEAQSQAMAPLGGLGQVGYDAKGRRGRIHIVVPGDTLWDISEAYLGSAWVWPSVWQDNREVENPHLIYPGDRIWITATEMRRVTREEAESLLARKEPPALPAAPAPSASPAEPTPTAAVRDTRPRFRVSSRESAGLISEDALESSASIVDALPDRVMLSQGDEVYIGLGESDVVVGDQFTVFRTQEKVLDPETGRFLGYHVDILGWVEVTETHPESSVGRIRVSHSEIERGDRIVRREPLPAEIELRDSPVGVDGVLSFFPKSRTVMGTVDFVYLNRGSLDGLEVGSPLEVYRPSFVAEETARSDRVRVPSRVVAQLIVVHAEPESAVAYVAHTNSELAIGDRFRGPDI